MSHRASVLAISEESTEWVYGDIAVSPDRNRLMGVASEYRVKVLEARVAELEALVKIQGDLLEKLMPKDQPKTLKLPRG